ncbi:T9SS type A sorting domain-containing protein [Winogradskyella thalassocola]|uniref:Por secretion system C-terminal sorting domain-containing protein n=1 Tax=Winogradskyella thalassocola TaxID=262004 RepID=A0A1G8K3G2_9FLAO|nr:T9SS type A sorting domain-containing protein [Winogradskyella thalassocola]SDI37941.1 Por secretion system C-terminal sorting domain-containing protein [Winogradskyella thalassocola]
MKKITSKNLSKKLANYGALSLAIGGLTDVSGQIIYTDVDPDFTGGVTINYGLDLDNDGTVDFNILAGATYSSGNFVQISNASISSNSILGSQPSFVYPFALDNGAAISSAQTSFYSVGTLNYGSCYGGVGGSNWCGVTDKYLGLRFQIAGNTHYGWAKLDVSASGDSFTVKEYAYNATAGEAIQAGQTLSVDQFAITKVRIVGLDNSIGLYNLPENTNYNVYDISGKSILNGSINDHSYVIEAKGFSQGVYIVELEDTFTNSVIRKKIVL